MENLNSELKFQPAAGKGGSRANASLPPKEQNQTPENQNSGKPKRRYWRFIIVFFAMIIGVFVLLNIGLWSWQKYRYWQDEKTAQKAEEGIRKWQQEDYERAMADTYGGKTPQETLQMYIEAVEKGNYELASRYFIEDRQEGELKSSREMSNDKIKRYINLLKDAIVKLNTDGKYDIENKYFSLYEPILIRIKIYPNNIWKIIEI